MSRITRSRVPKRAKRHTEVSHTKLQQSPSYHIAAYRSEPGKESQLERELVGVANQVKRERGVMQINLYKQVQGEGPNYLMVMVGENPGVAKRLTKSARFSALEDKLKNMSKKAKVRSTSTALMDYLGE